jgi:hypothetical protein
MKTDLERAGEILADQNFADEYDGDADAPCGYFALVMLPDFDAVNMAREYVRSHDIDIDTRVIIAGYLLVVQDSDGFTTVTNFAHENDARYEFDQLVAEYDEYLDDSRERMD